MNEGKADSSSSPVDTPFVQLIAAVRQKDEEVVRALLQVHRFPLGDIHSARWLISSTDPNGSISKLLSEKIEDAKKSMRGYSQATLQSLSQGKGKERGSMGQWAKLYRAGNTPFAKLLAAVDHNQQETVHELFKHHSFTADEIIQALEKAVSVEEPDIILVTMLLGKANFSVENIRHFLFLIIQATAIHSNRMYIIKLFLNHPGVVNEPDPATGMTALQLASQLGRYNIIAALLGNKADTTIRNKRYNNFSAWDYAALNGHTQIANKLLQYSLGIQDVSTALYLAAEKGNVELVEILLRYDPSVVNRPCQLNNLLAIDVASAAGNAGVVKLLLDNGAEITNKNPADGFTPLDRAAASGQIAVIEVMLSYRDRPIVIPPLGMALAVAAQNNHIAVVRRLLEYQPDLIREPSLALHSAIEYDRTEIASFLIDKGADLDEKDEFGSTPLCMAATRGNTIIVCLLLERGANLSHPANPWALAVQGGHIETMRILEKQYAEKGLSMHEVAIFYAVVNQEYANSVSILLQGTYLHLNRLFDELSFYGATCTTPLHLAAESGHMGILKQLLERSPESVHIVDKFGRTPLHIAAQNGHAAAVTMFLTHGANPEQVQNSRMAETIVMESDNILMRAENIVISLTLKTLFSGLKLKMSAPLEGRITALQIAQKLNHSAVIEAFSAFEKEKILKLLFPVFHLSKISPDMVKLKIENEKVELIFQNPQKAQIFLKKLCVYFTGIMAADIKKDTLTLSLPIMIQEKKECDAENTEKTISTFNDFLKSRLVFSRWVMMSFKTSHDQAYYGIQYYGSKQELGALEALISSINESGLAEISMTNKTTESIQFIFPEFVFENPEKNRLFMEEIAKILALKEAKKPRKEALTSQLRDEETKQKEEKQHREKALREAVKNRLLGKVQELLDQGVDVNARDDAGLTALHWAAQSYFLKMVSVLVAAGADVRSEDNAGRTALHWAVRSNFAGMISVLVESGADVNAKNRAGNTPLHSAAALPDVDAIVVDTLVAIKGINLAITNNEGQTAQDVASRKDRKEIMAVLIGAAQRASGGNNSEQTASGSESKDSNETVLPHTIEQKPAVKDNDQTRKDLRPDNSHEADERHINSGYAEIVTVKKEVDLRTPSRKGKKKAKASVKETSVISGMVGLKDVCDQLETLMREEKPIWVDSFVWHELEDLLKSGKLVGGWDLAMHRYIIQGISQILTVIEHRHDVLELEVAYQQLVLLRHRLVHNRLSDDMNSTELVFYNQRALLAMAQSIREFRVQDNTLQFSSSITKLLKTFKQQQPYSVKIEGLPYENYLSCIRINLLRLRENFQVLFEKCEKRNLSPGTAFLGGFDPVLISAIHAALYQVGEAYARLRLLLGQQHPEQRPILPFNKVIIDLLEQCKDARNREWHEPDGSGKQEITCVHEANGPGKMWELVLELNKNHGWLMQALLTHPGPPSSGSNPGVASSSSASSGSVSGLGAKAALFPAPSQRQMRAKPATILTGTHLLSKRPSMP